MFAGLAYGIISFAQRHERGYSVLRDISKEIKVEFEPGLQGYDTDREINYWQKRMILQGETNAFVVYKTLNVFMKEEK